MRLDSVRELKQELPKLLAQQFTLAEARVVTASVLVARSASFASVSASYALGITAARRKNDYRLALRLQRRNLVGSDLVKAIQNKAKGEVEVRYIGRVTAGGRGRLAASHWYQQRQRPLLIGSSCGYVRDDLV